MSKRLWRVVALVAVFALLAAACSNDEGTDDTTTTTAATTTTQAATTTTQASTTTAAGMEVATDVGVTDEPCPGGNPDHGCIYLGVLTDESGPFAAAAPALFGAQQAFWAAVNAQGGVGGYDVVVPDSLKKDTSYLPDVMVQSYNEIAGDVLAIAQSLGTPQTLAAVPDYDRDNTVAAPMSWYSGWNFNGKDRGLVIEFGTNYCFEGMNAVDWSMGALPAVGRPAPTTVGIAAFPNDYGLDYAAGVKAAAEANGLTVAWELTVIPISAGGDPTQVEVVSAIVSNPVDVTYLVTGPNETAAIVGGAASQGYQNLFIGAAPSWNVGILASPAAPAFQAGLYYQSSYVGGWDYESVGHATMRATLDAAGVTPNDFFISGWVSQYGLKAAIEAAIANGDLTKAGLAAAAKTLTTVGYDGMMAERSFAGSAQDNAPRASVIGQVDVNASTGISVLQDFFVGPTATGWTFDEPCS
ncbi:MAG: ABC transporter substrate-binding protein [Acidimicrobiia bacterium]|nr:ABC transporter substrate-binding protein [Acidimicrobiia bacterium]